MVSYGGFWRRVAAYFIDTVILYIGSSVVGAVLGVGIGASMAMMQSGQESIFTAAALTGGLITLVMQWLYFALMESSAMQATVGKLALGVIVTDLAGNRISFGRATGRYFAKILSAMILLIGYIMVGFTERKQGLHDMLAGTLVWKTRDPRLVQNDESIFA